jgi:hypothetical protein
MAPLFALELADHVVAHGFDSQKDALGVLYREARRRDVSAVLLDVTADEDTPRAVRERALGKLVVQFCRADA